MKTKIMNRLYKDIKNYYSDKLIKESQIVRFKQLSKIIEKDRPSINNIG